MTVDVDALADDAARKLATWHAARQARDDALHAFDDATRAEMTAAAEYRAAVVAYDENKRWR